MVIASLRVVGMKLQLVFVQCFYACSMCIGCFREISCFCYAWDEIEVTSLNDLCGVLSRGRGVTWGCFGMGKGCGMWEKKDFFPCLLVLTYVCIND